jgi:hypothetical protein
MPRLHWVVRGTGIPKDRDEVNRREVCQCDGEVCQCELRSLPVCQCDEKFASVKFASVMGIGSRTPRRVSDPSRWIDIKSAAPTKVSLFIMNR